MQLGDRHHILLIDVNNGLSFRIGEPVGARANKQFLTVTTMKMLWGHLKESKRNLIRKMACLARYTMTESNRLRPAQTSSFLRDANNLHGAVRMMHDSLRNAFDQKASQPRPPMRAKYDQVGMPLFGCLDDS